MTLHEWRPTGRDMRFWRCTQCGREWSAAMGHVEKDDPCPNPMNMAEREDK